MSKRARWTQEQLEAYEAAKGADKAPDAVQSRSEPKDEPELQRQCEKWLKAVGYRRRTPKEIQGHHGRRWFIHMNEAQNNPIMLDLLLIDATGGPYGVECLEVELKVDGGRMTPEQRCLVIRDEGVVCWSFDEFKDAVLLWHKAKEARRRQC